MKAISRKPENLWHEVERSLAEHSPTGYKMACIEAEKVFLYLLREKGYPTKNINIIMTLFGWRLSNRAALTNAFSKAEDIKNTFEYTLSSFEAEDIVSAFKQAIDDFSETKTLNWKRKITIFWDNYISFRSSFAKVALITIFSFFLLVKLLAHTKIGQNIVGIFVAISDFIFSWFILLIGGAIIIGIVASVIILIIENKTKIKEIK